MRGDDGDIFRQATERRPIEMIVMGVREKDQIDRRQLADGKRGHLEALRATGDEAQPDANAIAEDRIGEGSSCRRCG